MDLEVEKALNSGGHFFEKPYDIGGNSGARERNSEVPESTESLGSWCLKNPHSLKIGEINGAAKVCSFVFWPVCLFFFPDFFVWNFFREGGIFRFFLVAKQKTLGSYIYSYHVSIHCQFVHQHLSYGEAGWVGHCLHEPYFDLAWLVSKQPWRIPTKSWFCFKKAQLAFGTIFIPAWSNPNCAYIPRNLRCFPEIDI